MVFIENLESFIRLMFPLCAGIILAAISVFIFARQQAGGLFLAAIAAGFIMSLSFNVTQPAWSGLPLEIVTNLNGTASSDSRHLASGQYMLEIELSRTSGRNGVSAEAGGKALLFFKSDPHIFRGTLLAVESRLYVSDDYSKVMLRQKAGNVSLFQNSPVIFGTPNDASVIRNGWTNAAAEYRAALMNKILMRCGSMSYGSGDLFAALFTGSRDGLSAEETRIFKKAGCSHILALSGMHLGILSGIILILLKPLPGRKPAFIISCLIISLYLYLTGFGVSLVRAAIMYVIGGTAAVFYRKFKVIDVLMLSFVILVIQDPASFYSVSFQLSFLAVGGIITAGPVINRILKPLMPYGLSMAFSCSIGAQLFVSPLLLRVFGEMYPVGIAAGLIIAPMVTVFIWIGILYLITGFTAAASIAGLLYKVIFFVAEKAAGFPVVNAESAEPAVLIICSLLAAILVIYRLYRSRVDGISG